MGEDLCAPAAERLGEGLDLGHLRGAGEGDGVVEPGGGECRRRRSDRRRGRFSLAIQASVTSSRGSPRVEAVVDPVPAPLVQPLGPDEEEPPDAIERVVLPAPVAEDLLLDPLAALGDRLVAEAHDVERVDDDGDVRPRASGARWPGRRPPRPSGSPRGGRPRPPRSAPASRGASSAIHLRRSAASRPMKTSSSRPVSTSTTPVTSTRRRPPPGVEVHRLVEPDRPHAVEALGVVCERCADVAHRRPGGVPAHAEVPGTQRHRGVLLADPPADLGPAPGRSGGAGARPATTPRSRSWPDSRDRRSTTPACASGCAPGGPHGPDRAAPPLGGPSAGRSSRISGTRPAVVGRLHQVLELAVELVHLEQPESRQPEHRD